MKDIYPVDQPGEEAAAPPSAYFRVTAGKEYSGWPATCRLRNIPTRSSMMLRCRLALVALLISAGACGGVRRPPSSPADSYIARIDGPVGAISSPRGAVEWVRLESEDTPGQGVLFARFRSEADARATGGDLYRAVARINGRSWAVPPRVAVHAEWQLRDLSLRAAFEENRVTLFRKRIEAIPGFYADWLLERLDEPGRYLILGLYAETAAREQARTHPHIRAFAAAHPMTAFTAQDVYGVRNARVQELCTAATC